MNFQPWQTWCWVTLFTAYLGVFALLVIREIKERAATLTAVAVLALAAMWVERYLLVVPSLAPHATGFPYLTVLMNFGFVGVVMIVVVRALRRGPVESRLDLALKAEREAWT